MASKRMTKACINIEPELLERVKEIAKKRHCSYGQVIRTAVWEFTAKALEVKDDRASE